MQQPPFEISAARALVDQLLINGVDRAYCVPGESYLSVLDACYERGLPLTVCRNEAGAAMMADAYGKATGKPGICFVTRGPGAANAFAGVHIAAHDSTPMILFIGQVERFARGRGAFQEVDYPAMFGGEAKWVAEINDASRVNEFVSRAFALASAGRPGPVVLSLPKDMLEERIRAAPYPAAAAVETAPCEKDMRELGRLIAAASRPLLILGGTRWDEEARGALSAFAERFDIPVATSYRRLPLFDALDPRYAGDLGLNANPDADKARARQRSPVAGRRAAWGNSFAVLSLARYSLAAHDLRSCLSTGGGVRPRLRAQSRHSRVAARLRAGAERFASAGKHFLARENDSRASKTIWLFRRKARPPPMSI